MTWPAPNTPAHSWPPDHWVIGSRFKMGGYEYEIRQSERYVWTVVTLDSPTSFAVEFAVTQIDRWASRPFGTP